MGSKLRIANKLLSRWRGSRSADEHRDAGKSDPAGWIAHLARRLSDASASATLAYGDGLSLMEAAVSEFHRQDAKAPRT